MARLKALTELKLTPSVLRCLCVHVSCRYARMRTTWGEVDLRTVEPPVTLDGVLPAVSSTEMDPSKDNRTGTTPGL